MKTLEEIKEHLSTTVYDEDSKHIIAAFLFGKEIIKGNKSLSLDFASPKFFDDFVKWFNDSSKDYFQTKDNIVNDGKVLLEDELKNDKSELKDNVYQNGEWEEVNFDEIIKSLKDFKPVICEKVLSDSMLEKIMKELGIGDNDNSKKSNKYKERELSILDSMGLDKINPLALSTEALKAVNKLLQIRNDLAREIDEEVD